MTLVIFSATAVIKFRGISLSGGGALYTQEGKICDVRPISPFITKTVKDRPMVTMDH